MEARAQHIGWATASPGRGRPRCRRRPPPAVPPQRRGRAGSGRGQLRLRQARLRPQPPPRARCGARPENADADRRQSPFVTAAPVPRLGRDPARCKDGPPQRRSVDRPPAPGCSPPPGAPERDTPAVGRPAGGIPCVDHRGTPVGAFAGHEVGRPAIRRTWGRRTASVGAPGRHPPDDSGTGPCRTLAARRRGPHDTGQAWVTRPGSEPARRRCPGVAPPAGIEPAANRLEGGCSIR